MLLLSKEKRTFHERLQTLILGRSVSAGDYGWLEVAQRASLCKHLEILEFSA